MTSAWGAAFEASVELKSMGLLSDFILQPSDDSGDNNMVRIMPIGDSITFGIIQTGSPDYQSQSGGYRTVLYDSLLANGFTDVDFVGPLQSGPNSIDRDNAGYSGEATWQISNRISSNQIDPSSADIVLLMIGTNDIRQNFLGGAADRLSQLIDRITAFGVKVLVGSIPPINEPTNNNPNATNDVVAFNNAIPDIVASKGSNVRFVDIYQALSLNDLADGVHPNSLGYSKIGTAWYNALLPILDPNIDPVHAPIRGTPIRVEAESISNLVNFSVEDFNSNTLTGGTQGISLLANSSSNGTATTTFNAPSGHYDVVLGYFDQNNGQGKLQVRVGDDLLPTVSLNRNLNQDGVTSTNFVRQTVATGVSIKPGEPIQIIGTADGGEWDRVDYIEFVPVNDAPVLNATLVQTLTPIDEDTANNGDLVSNILGAAVTDSDTDAVAGIAVTAVDNTNGSWEYSTNNGINWTAFGIPDVTTARLLAADANTRIRFVPNPNYNGTPAAISFRAWDRTSGLAGGTADTNTFGSSTAFSAEIATTTIVNPINNAPVLNSINVNSVSLTRNSNNIFRIEGSSGQSQLLFDLTQRNTEFVNEVGVFVVDDDQGRVMGIAPGETGYLQAALSRSQVILSALPDGLGSANPKRQLSLEVGDALGFYLVQNSTADTVLTDLAAGQTPPNVFFAGTSANLDSLAHLEVSELGNNAFTLRWDDSLGGDNANFNDLALTLGLANEPPRLGTGIQGERELIDLRSQLGNLVSANFVVNSEAAYDNSYGFYAVDDLSGKIGGLNPGDPGYAAAAIANQLYLAAGLTNGLLLAPFLIADGTAAQFLAQNANNQQGQGPIAYFAYQGANPDGVDHVRLLGDNTFGFEDLSGGGDRDFNDLVVQADFA
jgi:lysophospholipase L1-like esterase